MGLLMCQIMVENVFFLFFHNNFERNHEKIELNSMPE